MNRPHASLVKIAKRALIALAIALLVVWAPTLAQAIHQLFSH
jgi:hypothetical protein